jgi:hypothetical protein
MLPNFAFHTCNIFFQQIKSLYLPTRTPKEIPTRDLSGFALTNDPCLHTSYGFRLEMGTNNGRAKTAV